MFSDPFLCVWKAYQGPKFIQDFRYRAGTVFCYNGGSTNRLKDSKVVAQVVRTMKESDDPLPPQMKKTLSVRMKWCS